MIVSNLQQFIRLLVPPLTAAGINQSAQKNVTTSIEAVATALDPFKLMSLDQLAEFLEIARVYRDTGVIPERSTGKKSGSGGTRAPKPSRMTQEEALTKLNDLQSRSIDYSALQIAEEIRALSPLTVKELQEIQREFIGAAVGKKKEEILASIQKKIDSFRASQQRVAGILAQ